MRLTLLLILGFVSGVCRAEKMAPMNSSPTPGVVLTRASWFRDNAYGIAVQADRKLVVAGAVSNGSKLDFAVLRYATNGAIDRSFGDSGKAVVDFGSGDDKAYAILVQPDGKIVAVGSGYNGAKSTFAFIRLLPTGQVDSTFALNGKAVVSLGTGDATAYAVALQPDGKLVAAGSAQVGENLQFAAVRVDSNGNLDYGFGNEGRTLISFGAKDAHGYSVALQADGKVVVAGYVVNDSKSQMAVIRLKTDGFLDSTFGNKGSLQISLRNKNNDTAYAVAVQPDQRILIGGSASDGVNLGFAVARLNGDGSFDKSFATGGSAVVPVGPSIDTVYGLSVLPSGNIVAAGASYDGFDFDFAAANLTSDGKVDPSFGTNGRVVSKLSKQYDAAYAVAVQPDGRLVSAGVAFVETRYCIAMTRLMPDGSLDYTFNGIDGNQFARAHEDNAMSAGMGFSLPSGLVPGDR